MPAVKLMLSIRELGWAPVNPVAVFVTPAPPKGPGRTVNVPVKSSLLAIPAPGAAGLNVVAYNR